MIFLLIFWLILRLFYHRFAPGTRALAEIVSDKLTRKRLQAIFMPIIYINKGTVCDSY